MNQPSSSAVERFAAALRGLYEAADSPKYRVLVHQGSVQRPPVKLNESSISDWLGGRSIPANEVTVRFMVALLKPRAAGQDGYEVRPLDWWLDLYRRAQADKKTSRGGQPAARRTGSSSVESPRLGRPINQYTPLGLEVHRAIDVPGHRDPLPMLPPYVARAHDARLREIVDAAAGGLSRMAVLVGGSSTGKTRACWEAVQHLPADWSLWHPINPSRPDAAARALGEAGPYTLVWLNEAHHYLLPPDPALGERIAAGLRTLLSDPGRSPVLVLATIWPQDWAALTALPPVGGGGPDPHAQARELLSGTDIRVPDTFTGPDLQALHAAAHKDLRMRHAAEHAQGGRITQHLAGVPEVVQRYNNAPPAARAVIDVAIDARRLGHPLPIPYTLLEQAAPGYLHDHDWEQAGEDWLEQALAHTAAPCHGVPGPLTRIRPRPGEHSTDGQSHYRLADYLEQTGRAERAGVFPPPAFWDTAATTITNPEVLRELGRQAERRGRYHRATQLYRQAADLGDPHGLRDLAGLRERAGDSAGAESLAVQAADRGDTFAPQNVVELPERAADRGDALRLWYLAGLQERAGDSAGADSLAVQAADRGDTFALRYLAGLRERAGDSAGADSLAVQAADRGDTFALGDLAGLRERAGDSAGAESLAVQAADRGDTSALGDLAGLRERAGDQAGAESLYRQAADRGDTSALGDLAGLRERAGDQAGAESLYRQAADRGDTSALGDLAGLRERAGDQAGAESLYRQAADRGDTSALWNLAGLRERAGDQAGAESLAVQAADRGDTSALWDLVELREQAGDQAGAESLYRQAADRGDTSALWNLAELREQAGDQAGADSLAVQAADRGNPDALMYLVELRERAGDRAGADSLAVQAADRGDTSALGDLAGLREQAGDRAGAESLYRQAADRGDTRALWNLAELREHAGDPVDADHVRRFGLTDAGSPAASLDFGLPSVPISVVSGTAARSRNPPRSSNPEN